MTTINYMVLCTTLHRAWKRAADSESIDRKARVQAHHSAALAAYKRKEYALAEEEMKQAVVHSHV